MMTAKYNDDSKLRNVSKTGRNKYVFEQHSTCDFGYLVNDLQSTIKGSVLPWVVLLEKRTCTLLRICELESSLSAKMLD